MSVATEEYIILADLQFTNLNEFERKANLVLNGSNFSGVNHFRHNRAKSREQEKNKRLTIRNSEIVKQFKAMRELGMKCSIIYTKLAVDYKLKRRTIEAIVLRGK